MNFFNGKYVLITGASSGIGKALAEKIAGPGVSLLISARNRELLEDVKKSCSEKGAEVSVLAADLSDTAQVSALADSILQRFPRIDVLINNAGMSQRSQAEETRSEVDRQIMELNFFSPVLLTKQLWPVLLKSPHANIVNISSVTGTFGFPQRSAYAASKHAIEGFFESWMLENRHPNIHFTIVAPGRILTNISYHALKSDGSRHQTMDEGQANGIPATVCAERIVRGIARNRRKIYIVKQERILLLLHRFFPALFVSLVRKLDLK